MKLQDARRQRLISVAELAKLAGVSSSAIFNIEAGRNKPNRMETVRKISRALNVPAQMIDEFIPTAGTPEEFIAGLVERDGARIVAAIERADAEGWIEEQDLKRNRRAQAEPVAA